MLQIVSGVSQGRVLLATAGSEGPFSGFIGAGDALGLARIQATLLGLPGMEVDVVVVRQADPELDGLIHRNNFIISIGGPYANSLSRRILEGQVGTLRFKELTVADSEGGKSYPQVLDASKSSGHDWAIVRWASHPTRGGSGRAIVLAGIGGFGSEGAAAVFADLGSYEQLRRIAESGYFEALVKVPFRSGKIESPTVVLCRPLSG